MFYLVLGGPLLSFPFWRTIATPGVQLSDVPRPLLADLLEDLAVQEVQAAQEVQAVQAVQEVCPVPTPSVARAPNSLLIESLTATLLL